MANNDLAMRFTENAYATKNEVSKELKISMIDGVWDKVLSYRSMFYQYLQIKGVDRNQLRVCLCLTVARKVNEIESKLNRLLNEYRKLNHVNGDLKYFEQTYYIKSVQNLALKNNKVCDEEVIRQIVQGTNRDQDLLNYVAALKFVSESGNREVDVDYLAALYSIVTGNDELTSFYRDSDVEGINSSAIISRVYKCAPYILIEQMMDNLFGFINKNKVSPIVKAIITYYYVEFVKPFKKYNDEIAILLAKTVLAKESIQEFASFFPLEILLNENPNDVNRLFNEVQQTSDTTYYLVYALDSVDKLIDKMIENAAEYTAQIIKNDFFGLDEEKEEKVEEEKPQEVKVEQAPIVKEVIREIIREVPVPTPVPAPEVKVEKKVEVVEDKPKGLAVSFIPEELDEKTALRLERHLLELDVRLKKGQAYFYARHCTLGMFYTIDQYKKAVKCVYETARTSMDQLVEFGYYKKQLVGKKFVYTPIERK